MLKLARVVPIADLLFQNAGGLFWNKVKSDPEFQAPWQVVSKAKLWTDEGRYRQSVWPWLLEGAEDWTVATSSKHMSKDDGRQFKMEVDLGHKIEFLALASATNLIRTRGSMDVVLIDVNNVNETLDADAITAISYGSKQQHPAKFILICTFEAERAIFHQTRSLRVLQCGIH